MILDLVLEMKCSRSIAEVEYFRNIPYLCSEENILDNSMNTAIVNLDRNFLLKDGYLNQYGGYRK